MPYLNLARTAARRRLTPSFWRS